MAKRKARFKSLSTPGLRQDCSNYLVELAFLRANRGQKLQPKFWQQTRYKFQYKREIQACRRFIKKFGEPEVLYVAMNNYITTWTDFAKIEFLLQQLDERKTRMSYPKDISNVSVDFMESTIDVRDSVRPQQKKIGLFDRIQELEGGENKN